MPYRALAALVAMPYRWGLFEAGVWTEQGRLTITPDGVLLDGERLANPRYDALSRSLAFGAEHGTFARTGRLLFDTTQLYFHGTMEQDDGASRHIVGFADFDVTYQTIIRPIADPTGPSQPGPALRIAIDTTALSGPIDEPVVTFTLTTHGIPADVTSRVTSHGLNRTDGTFEITMGPGGPFPPTFDLFDITMATDMSGFEGTYSASSQASDQFSWSGKPRAASMAALVDDVARARQRLQTAGVRQVRNVAATARLQRLAGLAPSKPVTDDDPDGPAVLPGLDAQDLTFIASMDAIGIKIATLDNIRAIEIQTDDKGKPVVVNRAQDITAAGMNAATLQSLAEPWKSDFLLKIDPLDKDQQKVADAHSVFFANNAALQMGSLLKYKQKSFAGVDLAAVETISQPKLDATWKFATMTPDRLQGYMAASTDMYACGYTQIAGEFKAYADGDREAWARAYFHWLTDPSQLGVWQKQFALLDGAQVSAWIYEWHAKLSILAPLQPYAPQMAAYALATFIVTKATVARWVDGATPLLEAAIAGAGEANATAVSAAGEPVSDPNAVFIGQRLGALATSVGAEVIAAAISAAALEWQAAHATGAYYAYLYTDPAALDEIAKQLAPSAAAAFRQWLAAGPPAESNGRITAGAMLAYCVYTATAGFLLAGLAPKDATTAGAADPSPSGSDITWVLKGLKISQVILNAAAAFYQFLFIRRVASLWTQYVGEAGEEMPQLARAIRSITAAIEDADEIPGWGLAFGGELSATLRVAGPIFALIGIALSIYNLCMDIIGGRPVDGVLDVIGLIIGVAAFALGLSVLLGLMTAATAGPIGLAIAVVGLIVLAFKLLFDWLFPSPTPIQSFVAGPLTDLGVVGA